MLIFEEAKRLIAVGRFIGSADASKLDIRIGW